MVASFVTEHVGENLPQPSLQFFFRHAAKLRKIAERVQHRLLHDVGGVEPGLESRFQSDLRSKLSQKAKQEPRFRFYALYDRISRLDVLQAAWREDRKPQTAAGVDGDTLTDIEASEGGVRGFLMQLHKELCSKRYRPDAVRRVEFPKPDGRTRPLGIPTIRDRVVQMAVLLILEPIFEADFRDSSYGFRPGRSAHDALDAIRSHLQRGKRDVYDADLKGCFEGRPHAPPLLDRRTPRLFGQKPLHAQVQKTDDSCAKS
jgi:retron-type reverse transcriptase